MPSPLSPINPGSLRGLAVLLAAAVVVGTLALAGGCEDDSSAAGEPQGVGGNQNVGGFSASASASGSGASGGENEGGQGMIAPEWDEIYEGRGSAFTKDVAIDGDGNIIVTGAYTGTFDFGMGPETSQGAEDIFVAKYDAGGMPVWANVYGAAGFQTALAVAANADGTVFLCGFAKDAATFTFGGDPDSITPEGQFSDIWVAVLDPGGNHVESTMFNNTVATGDECHGVDIASDGSAWFTGVFQSAVVMGDALGAAGGAGDKDAFLLHVSSEGAVLGARRFGGTALDHGLEVAASPDGDVAVVGFTAGDVDFGGGLRMSGSSENRGFVVRLDAALEHEFSAIFTGDNVGSAIDADFSGEELVVAGNFRGSIDLGGGELTAMGANDDLFVARYDQASDLVWGRRYGGTSSEQVGAMAVNEAGYPVLAGKFNGSFGVNSSTTLDTMGSFDGMIVKLGPPGNGFWGFQFGDSAAQAATAVAVDGEDIVVVGDFSGDVDLGSGPVGGTHLNDIFVAKFGG
jgi:hypothetical protein